MYFITLASYLFGKDTFVSLFFFNISKVGPPVKYDTDINVAKRLLSESAVN